MKIVTYSEDVDGWVTYRAVFPRSAVSCSRLYELNEVLRKTGNSERFIRYVYVCGIPCNNVRVFLKNSCGVYDNQRL